MVNNEQINTILKKHPSLNFNSEEGCFYGYVQIDEDDKYNLKIDINNTSRFPRVYELDDRIPRKADRHVNIDYSLCFTTKANELIQLKTKVKDLDLFFDLVLIPYLQNNSFYEINKFYKFGAYRHNDLVSTYETYKDILNIENFDLMSNLLHQVSKGVKIRPNETCYCGSNLKIKKCKNHEIGYRNLKKIEKERLLSDSQKINELRKHLIEMNKKNCA